MQPMLIKINMPGRSSFSLNRSVFYDGFPGIWHFHDEYEMTLILSSSGSRMVGDSIERFTPGDLTFIGKNLPHTWRNDEPRHNEKSEVLVLHFLDGFLGDSFFNIPEMEKLKTLIQRSHRGIKITGKTRDHIAGQLLRLEHISGVERIITVLSMLHSLSESDELYDLSSEGFVSSIDELGSNRLNRVYEYIMNNFQSGIGLVEVAAVANMSPAAFSRYFKSRTRKSFTQFIIELKVGYACKLLMKDDISVTQVCYECGFLNLSNFNKQFKEITKITPKKYQLIHATK